MKQTENKSLFIFAGPNASGKSTVIQNLLINNLCPKYYICPDQLVPEGKKDDIDEYIKAMQKAEELRIKALNDGSSFTFETVFSTKEKLDFLLQAKKQGYKITTIYITTSDPSINIKRVKERVRQGGHNVPEDKVVSRYEKCMNLMFNVILASDVAKVYDNSASLPVQVLEKSPNKGIYLLNREQRHNWVEKYIIEKFIVSGKKTNKDLSCQETKRLKLS